jgi:hypothetical protein
LGAERRAREDQCRAEFPCLLHRYILNGEKVAPPRRGRDALGTAGKMPALRFFYCVWCFYPMCLEVLALSKRLLKADG